MNSASTTVPTDLTNERLPSGRLLALGLQHVLVMYAGTVAVPLIVGGALKLPKDQLAFLINADLFAAGLATLIQAFGFWKFGIRLPVMMGVTFASVAPMIAIGTDPNVGLLGIYGAVIASGIFGILIAPMMGRMLGLFPPVVTGTVITLIGVSLMRVGINWAAGGQPTTRAVIDGVVKEVPNLAYGDLANLGIAGLTLLIILLLTKYGRGLVANCAVLLGIIAGTLVAMAMGKVSFEGLDEASFMAVITPLHFGIPTFEVTAILSMCIVMLITLVESTGMFLALSDITGKKLSNEDLTRGLRADGLGTVIGGIFNTFPYTSFSQNVGLVTVTGVRSRYVAAAGGIILIAFGLFPKMAHVVASVPQFVLGGAGIVMFGMVAATGIRILGSCDFNRNRYNLFIVAISIGAGMIPTLAPTFFQYLPKWTGPFTHSGIVLGTIVAVALNLFYNGIQSREEAMRNAAANSHGTE
ncbi:nucleobase:cation symporter 2 (NCS2) family transporter [Cupriavidus necator N-1]|jgi:NCS2 family nucleobase:cation symporter-2|uniref:Nucleobase:cation symporter 2 (NCS2) family transporter n=1 Tax=Cupriavidus necator (strain ATCC 43291 / DSM 13513 / CCUG 52238 / LMG 8453 / N-1) TaxID=1042878 RepID=G0EZK2_CUPNN|nr:MULTISPECIES: nucleobase:cation symporter-2 family protein [Cupriavidus]AEI76307.1 nucleobase:cation symporter 2 (NCS2) family transporter [Cupriavidus necator N-1]KAI3596184.1 Xanthine-uracil permease [Cupriavidus necator H850]MDX6011570.1 nucleobase:cation symporter-2 family protein [Cupriavidus necator]QUN29312.1 purine permease [Cupriavidus sp. KK10]